MTRRHDRPRALLAAQSGIWATQRRTPGEPIYQCAAVFELSGPLDRTALRRAVGRALTETETLRTRFHDTPDGPRLTVEPAPPAGLTEADLTGHPDPEAAAAARMREDLATATDLTREPPCAHTLFTLGADRGLLFLRYHHIALDGFGQYLHCRRLAELYTAFESGRTPAPAPAAPLDRLLAEDAAYHGSAQHTEDAAYWRAEFATAPPGSALTDGTAPPGPAVRRSTVLAPERLTALLGPGAAAVGRESAALVAAVGALLHGLRGATDVVVNVPMTARRSRAELHTPAMLANELPVRLAVDAGTDFAGLVRQAATKIRHALRHQRYRRELLLRLPALAGHPSALSGPQVNVMAFGPPPRFGSCRTGHRQLPTGLVADLNLNVHREPAPHGTSPGGPGAHGLRLELCGNSARYGPDDLTALQERFLGLLEAVAGRPGAPLGRLARI
ncbi:hypothetical protein OQI_31965 [Streptomyces pharetrae CZA14]|uniref:Condensation domain-containing protein n=1 Tax=Streptomyces pharetrae CZA14 TaxID=1144883 RepID=A0ABX3Y9V5_9ACTN|nr:hypothetical protein OQI_31965 [Streptomyces pharetrae CZA14]